MSAVWLLLMFLLLFLKKCFQLRLDKGLVLYV